LRAAVIKSSEDINGVRAVVRDGAMQQYKRGELCPTAAGGGAAARWGT
jgi:hypothetical protein